MTLLALVQAARAEGTSEFGSTQELDPVTKIYVDILDYGTETNRQLAAATDRAGEGDLTALLHSRPTWPVGPEPEADL